jgi:hypothetical protein
VDDAAVFVAGRFHKNDLDFEPEEEANTVFDLTPLDDCLQGCARASFESGSVFAMPGGHHCGTVGGETDIAA